MIIVFKKGFTEQQLKNVAKYIEGQGLKVDHLSAGTERTLIGAIGDESKLSKEHLELMPGVEKVMPVLKDYRLVSREFQPKDTVIDVEGVKIGGKELAIAAGPCAIESEEQLMAVAHAVKKSGAKILRASAYKPRTSPYAFQGMGEEGLKLLKKAKKETGLVTETEIMDIRDVELVAKYSDMLRVGARNTQNFDLLRELGKINKPVILKNGMSTTLKEWLLAAEYIVSQGNENVILCLRGIRTYETATRFTMDLGLIPVIKKETHLPVIVDPSHCSGKNFIVQPMARAAIAAGADGLIVEVHNCPEKALCDGKQALLPSDFDNLMTDLKKIAPAVGRKL